MDEVGSADEWPAREAVKTFGPAYRYPAAGWIYLHIEGKPYERGYQHGYLMAREIPEYLTFDDVLMKPGASSVLPAEVSTRTRITRGIKLSIPVISAGA